MPTASADFSLALDESELMMSRAAAPAGQNASERGNVSSGSANFELGQPLGDPETTATGRGTRSSIQTARTTAHDSPVVPSHSTAGSSAGRGGLPGAIVQAPQAVWYVRPPSGGQYGPADGHTFYEWLLDNRVSPDSLVWRDGWAEWLVAGDAFEDYFGSAWRLASAPSEAAGSALPAAAEAAPLSLTGPGDVTIRDSIGTVADYAPVKTTDVDDRHPRVFTEVDSPASPPTLSVAEARRRKKRAQYGIMIAVLGVLAIVLLVVFVMVIVNGAN